MNIEIKRLTADLAEDYLHFFDATPHDKGLDADKCYCVTWRSDVSFEKDGHWFPTREERRSKAAEFVRSGSIQGYLAYADGEVIGWCNANADCRMCVDFLRGTYPIAAYDPKIRVKSVFCFVVAPKMQRKGVSVKLLEAVVSDAEREGFDFVEGYCNKRFIGPAEDFRGTMAMFEKCGFEKYAVRDGKAVMRKACR